MPGTHEDMVQAMPVQFLPGLVGILQRFHLDEGEALRISGLLIREEMARFDLATVAE